MRVPLLIIGLAAGCLHAAPALAQFGQNPLNRNNPQVPGNARLLPNSGAGYLGGGNYQNSPFNTNRNFNNGFANNGFNNGFNGAGFNGFNNGYGFNNPGYGFNGFQNGFGGYNNGFGNQFNGNFGGGFGGGFNAPWNYGNNFYGPAPPFGGYQFPGYGNFAPIVGVNNGWWPYEPAYNYNNPVDQYLNQLFLQGLPGSGSAPSSLNSNPRR